MVNNYANDAKIYELLKNTGIKKVKETTQYLKIVEWSEKDKCCVGRCLGIIGPCCHGDDEVQVYRELCQIVDEWIKIMLGDGKSLPHPTAGNNLTTKLLAQAA